MTAARLVAALGGVGWLRPAPGTFGSAAVLPAAWLGAAWCLGLAALLFVLGVWAVGALARDGAADDPGWVVIDEGAGMLLTLAAVPAVAPGWWVLVAFALFRAFDIGKPGPVGWADRRHGPVWVMLDDVFAGALAAVVLLALRWAAGESA